MKMKNAFNVDISDISILPQSKNFHDEKFSEFMPEDIFTKNQNGKRVLDGKRLEESWFKPITADFFISHKGENVNEAKKLGAYLQSKGKTVFIDSLIWRNISRLQRLIDNDYCKTAIQTYAYEKRNKSTSYTHMLLANALLKTIANCENFVFLNTPESVKAVDTVTGNAETNSPWIYFEINVANSMLRKTGSTENFAIRESMGDSMIEMAFETDLRNFCKVNIGEFLGKIGIEF